MKAMSNDIMPFVIKANDHKSIPLLKHNH